MDNRPPTDKRDELAAADDRPRDTRVATTFDDTANGGYSFHDLDADEEPRCGAGGPSTEFEIVTIAEAHRRNKAPCQMCTRWR